MIKTKAKVSTTTAIEKIKARRVKNNAKILITNDPLEATNLADCVMTDKWISMGDKANKKKKEKIVKTLSSR